MTMIDTGGVEQLLGRPYRRVITGDADEGYLAMVPELPGCFTAGETPTEALEMLEDAMAGWFESALARGLAIPEPAGRESGRLLVRMPKSIHRRLMERAEEEGVSANTLAVSLLAKGL